MNYNSNEIIEAQKIKIENYLSDLGIENVRKEIVDGLKAKQKYISSKFFYDDQGSRLFEEITRLPEYYPTRTEKSILKEIAPELMGNIENLDIVELGSGDCSKIGILLSSVSREKFKSIEYIPLDVSKSAILKSSKKLTQIYPDLAINGLVADFVNQLDIIPENRKRMFCFLGSTLGNFTENAANEFIKNISLTMNSGDTFLLGVDLVKPMGILHNAYNDKQGITAEFNKNILNVINGLIDSDFDKNNFEHKAFFYAQKSRIEMHLVATKNITIRSSYFDSDLFIKKGENIHTENSYKFTPEKIKDLENTSSLKIDKIFTDPNKWFALVLFKK